MYDYGIPGEEVAISYGAAIDWTDWAVDSLILIAGDLIEYGLFIFCYR